MRTGLVAVTFLCASCTTAGRTIAAPDAGSAVPYGAPAAQAARGGFDAATCTFDGHPLYGRIQVVDALADVTVQVVTALPDLRVQKVTALPDGCGEWQMVEGLPDTTVQLVTALGDVSVQFVEALPGVP